MKKTMVSLLALSCLFPTYSFAQTDLSEEVSNLKNVTEELRTRLLNLESSDLVERSRDVNVNGIPGPHFGIDATYDGAKLLINEPSLNKDIGLLKQKQYLNKAFGSVEDNGSRVLISGTVGTSAAIHSNSFGKDRTSNGTSSKSNIAANGELDFSAQLNDWWTAYTKFEGNTDNGTVSFNQGFVTFGNLDVSPLYSTVGYYFVPNGGFSSRMVTGNLPKKLARTKAKAVTLGYTDNEVNTSIYMHNGKVNKGNSTVIDHWGSNFEYSFPMTFAETNNAKFKLGASFMSDLASSDGMGSAFNSDTKVSRYVPAFDLRANIEYEGFGFLVEHVSAIKHFIESELSFNSSPAKPSASMVEGYINFTTLDKPSYLAVSYGKSKDALAISLPKQQYGTTYSVSIFKNTAVYLEYMHKRDYHRANKGNAASLSNPIKGTGRHDNVLTAEIDVYF